MERALVVVEDTKTSRELLADAAALAAGVGAGLVVLSLADGEEEDAETARERAASIAGETVGDAEYEAVGALAAEGERAGEIIRTADEHGCDHVFLTGRRRSPAGKAVYGSAVQAVILNFPGRVTVSTE
jgi:nucleotide-binding universal stress UspA family protein